jgi:MoaA/NifB/PqqE/SkfB family radical SAM enzyme
MKAEILDALPAEGDGTRLVALGVDLSKYSLVSSREEWTPLEASMTRDTFQSLRNYYTDQMLGRVPDPLMLTHIITNRCNYSCNFCCYADSLNTETKELSLAEIETTYPTLGSNLNVIVYSGGEPTLRRDLAQIVEAAYQLTPVKSVYIISNAWKPDLIFETTHRLAQRCPSLHLTWSLSIEGRSDVNNEVRYTKAKGWDAWQNTVDSLEGLKSIRQQFGYQELDVQLCTVCSPNNVHGLDDWYETVRDVLQPDKWNLNLMRRSNQMSAHSLSSFDQRRAAGRLEPFEEKYLELTEKIRKDVLAGRLRFLYHTSTPEDGALKSALDLVSQEDNCNTLLEREALFPCRAGSAGAYISGDGEVSGCEEFVYSMERSKSLGKLRDVDCDFGRLWRSDRATEMRRQVGKAKECRGCTLESQRNYPSILVSFKSLLKAKRLARRIR